MVKIVFILVSVLLIAIGIYIASIYFVRTICKISLEDAKKSVDKFLGEILSSTNTAPNVTYPVLIGSNGFAIRDEIVTSLFSRLDHIYATWYFERADYVSQNVVTYVFRVYDCLLDIDRKRILSRARIVGETALSMHWHELGIYTLPVDNFCAVRILGDRLFVFYALNDLGCDEVRAIREQP